MVVIHATDTAVEAGGQARSTTVGRRSHLKYYPPAHTPLSAGALAGAAVRACARPGSASSELAARLLDSYRADDVRLYGSGTQALCAAISAVFDARRGSRIVALPSWNCYDVAAAAIAADARIVVYDIDPETLSPDLDSFRAALAMGADAAVVAPLYGFPVDWTRLEEIAAAHGTAIIEDAAQGIGGLWHGAPLGSLGRVSVLSFGRGKGWTGGGGGAVLLRGSNVVLPDAGTRRGRGARNAVLAAAQWMLSDPRVYALPASIPGLHLGDTVYKPVGEVHGMADYAAALLLSTADAAIREAAARMRTGAELQRAFAGARDVQPVRVVEGGAAGYLRFPLRVRPQLRAQWLEDFRHHGIAPGYPGTIPDLAAVRPRLVLPELRCAGADTLVREVVTLPTYPGAHHARRQIISGIARELHSPADCDRATNPPRD